MPGVLGSGRIARTTNRRRTGRGDLVEDDVIAGNARRRLRGCSRHRHHTRSVRRRGTQVGVYHRVANGLVLRSKKL